MCGPRVLPLKAFKSNTPNPVIHMMTQFPHECTLFIHQRVQPKACNRTFDLLSCKPTLETQDFPLVCFGTRPETQNCCWSTGPRGCLLIGLFSLGILSSEPSKDKSSPMSGFPCPRSPLRKHSYKDPLYGVRHLAQDYRGLQTCKKIS